MCKTRKKGERKEKLKKQKDPRKQNGNANGLHRRDPVDNTPGFPTYLRMERSLPMEGASRNE